MLLSAETDRLLGEQFGRFSCLETGQQTRVDGGCHPAVAGLAAGLQPAGMIWCFDSEG